MEDVGDVEMGTWQGPLCIVPGTVYHLLVIHLVIECWFFKQAASFLVKFDIHGTVHR